MSPTVFYKNGMRFFFFSLEENRMHIHIRQAEKKAAKETGKEETK